MIISRRLVTADRKIALSGKSVELGGRPNIKKKGQDDFFLKPNLFCVSMWVWTYKFCKYQKIFQKSLENSRIPRRAYL